MHHPIDLGGLFVSDAAHLAALGLRGIGDTLHAPKVLQQIARSDHAATRQHLDDAPLQIGQISRLALGNQRYAGHAGLFLPSHHRDQRHRLFHVGCR